MPKSVKYLTVLVLIVVLGISSMYLYQMITGQPIHEVIPVITSEEKAAGVPFYGPVDISAEWHWDYDKSFLTNHPAGTLTPTSVTMYHIGADGNPGQVSKTFSNPSSGSVNASGTAVWKGDKGKLWLVVDWGTTTSYYADQALTENQEYFMSGKYEGIDVDQDGTKEACFLMDFGDLPAPVGGQTATPVSFNLFGYKYDSTTDITNLANLTSVSTSAYTDYSINSYILFDGKGYGLKVIRLYITMPDSANNTLVDTGQVKLTSVETPFGTFEGSDITWDLANSRWTIDIGVDDTNNEVSGIPVIRGPSDGTYFFKIDLNLKIKMSSSGTWAGTIYLYYLTPASVQGSRTQVVQATTYSS